MPSLSEKLAALKAKHANAGDTTSSKAEIKFNVGKLSTDKPDDKPADKPKPSSKLAQLRALQEGKKVESASSDVDNLLVQAGNLRNKVEEHLAKQEEKGLYTVPDAADGLEGFDGDTFIRNLRDLDAAVVEKTPDIRRFSTLIRENLEQYPELTHILSEEQLGIIVSGVLTTANVDTAPKSKAAKTKASKKKIEDLANTNIDDLFGGM